MKIQLPIDVMNKVLGYLGTRPFQEVHELISAVQSTATTVADPVPETKDEQDGIGGD